MLTGACYFYYIIAHGELQEEIAVAFISSPYHGYRIQTISKVSKAQPHIPTLPNTHIVNILLNYSKILFDFVPKMLCFNIRRDNNAVRVRFLPFTSDGFGAFMYQCSPDALTTDYIPFGGNEYQQLKKSPDGKTITWYGTTAAKQGNIARDVYYWVAIG